MNSSTTSTRRISTSHRLYLDRRVAAYLAATASIGAAVTEAQAVVISDSSIQHFGINGDVNIDFNSDGQIDYQIDHDRVHLNDTDIDYLQIDKNDVSSAENPYPIDNFMVFPENGTHPNSDHEFISSAPNPGDQGYYPKALPFGATVGPTVASNSRWEIWQEGENFISSHRTIRPNRLIDEDATLIDQADPDPPAESEGSIAPFGTPGWKNHEGQTLYLGMRIDLNDAGHEGFNNLIGSRYWYGWIGVRVTNEADATGDVVGWGYQTVQGTGLTAGQTGFNPGDFNFDGKVDSADYVYWRKNNLSPAKYTVWKNNYGETSGGGSGGTAVIGRFPGVPEPSSLLLGMGASVAMLGTFLFRRISRGT